MSKASVLDVVTHRDFGWVRYVCISKYPKEPQVEVLKRLGLVFEGHPLREVQDAEAQWLLEKVFSTPLAYSSSPVPSVERAQELASACMGSLFPVGSQYYTNVAPDLPVSGPLSGFIAASVGHTFAVGVIAISPSVAACVWVEEED